MRRTEDMSRFLVRRAFREFEGIVTRDSHLEVVVDEGGPSTDVTAKLFVALEDNVAMLATDGDMVATWGDDARACNPSYFEREEVEAFLRAAERTWPGILRKVAE